MRRTAGTAADRPGCRCGSRARAAQAVDRSEEAQVLLDGQVEVERELLAHVPEPALPGIGLGGDVDAAEPGDAARRGREQPGEHADGGGLAGPVGPEEAEDAPARNVDVDVPDGDERRRSDASGPRAGDEVAVRCPVAFIAARSPSRRSPASCSPCHTNTSSSDGAITRTSSHRPATHGLPDLGQQRLAHRPIGRARGGACRRARRRPRRGARPGVGATACDRGCALRRAPVDRPRRSRRACRRRSARPRSRKASREAYSASSM